MLQVLKKFHEDDVEFFPIETFVARSECKADCRLCRNDACGVADQEFTIESSDRMIPRVRCRERALGGEAKKEDLHEAVHNLSSGGSSLPNCNPLSQNSANLLQDLSVSSDQCCLSVVSTWRFQLLATSCLLRVVHESSFLAIDFGCARRRHAAGGAGHARWDEGYAAGICPPTCAWRSTCDAQA